MIWPGNSNAIVQLTYLMAFIRVFLLTPGKRHNTYLQVEEDVHWAILIKTQIMKTALWTLAIGIATLSVFPVLASSGSSEDPGAVVYADVKIKNNTDQEISGKVYYADVGFINFCDNDNFTIEPWGSWSHSRGSCLITKITASYTGWGKVLVGEINVPVPQAVDAKSYTSSGTGYSTFQVTRTSDGMAVYRTGSDWDDDVTDAFTKVYYSSVDFVNDAARRSENAADAVAANTKEMANQGIDVASKEFKDMSTEAEKQLSAGVEIVEDAAIAAYDWVDQNACRIAVTTAISVGAVAYFTPKPAPGDPGTVTSTSMSATAYAYMSKTISKAVASQSMAYVATESFLLIPGVKGNVDKQLLQNVIANTISTSLDCVPCWGTPAGVGIAVAGGVAPIVAELVCTGITPSGFTKRLAEVNRMPSYPSPPTSISTTTSSSSASSASAVSFSNLNIKVGSTDKVLDLNRSYGTIIQYGFHGGSNQQWTLKQVQDGYYQIVSVATGKAFDLNMGNNTVTEYASHGNDNQLWKIKMADNGSVNLISKANGKAIEVASNGSLIVATRDAKKESQQFRFSGNVPIEVDSKFRTIMVGNTNNALDLNMENGSISSYALHGNDNQMWSILPVADGYYKITSKKTQKVFDLNMGNSHVTQYAFHGGDNQLWKVELCSDGRYQFVSKANGKALEIDANGILIVGTLDTDKESQKFKMSF